MFSLFSLKLLFVITSLLLQIGYSDITSSLIAPCLICATAIALAPVSARLSPQRLDQISSSGRGSGGGGGEGGCCPQLP